MKLLQMLAISGLLVLINSCDNKKEKKVGSSCEYADIPGSAELVKVYDKSHSVEVYLNFTPDDSVSYRFPDMPDTNVMAYVCQGHKPRNPEWIKEQGLTVGSFHPCRRREITKGTCTPVLFELTDVDCTE